jgi:hypothetical protein
MINRTIKAGYKLLNLQTYFTVGNKEIYARNISIGTKALQAASKIHTDFGRGFICAEVINYKNYIFYKGFENAKHYGKLRLEGSNYTINDGDIINFRFNV